MKLNYHDFRSGEYKPGEVYNGEFKVRVSVSEYDSEPILAKFKEKYQEKMKLYMELTKQEKEITKTRKVILKELKEEFSIFAKSEVPEMYL
ncbi:MAG: hypothetical protein J7L15_03160 [Clostridiales bacterium]|nr:hypothetical protein [Clostridiales bacterium]